jgi:hypothetical protein
VEEKPRQESGCLLGEKVGGCWPLAVSLWPLGNAHCSLIAGPSSLINIIMRNFRDMNPLMPWLRLRGQAKAKAKDH